MSIKAQALGGKQIRFAYLAIVIAALTRLIDPAIVRAEHGSELPVAIAVQSRRFGPITAVQFSHDGKRIAYSVIQQQKSKVLTDEQSYGKGIPWWAIGADIVSLDIETGETTSLTSGVGSNWFPMWSPDGQTIAFFSDRDGSGRAKLWTWDLMKNSLRKISDVEAIGDSLAWFPNGRELLITSLPYGRTAVDSLNQVLTGGMLTGSAAEEVPNGTATLYRSPLRIGKGQEQAMSDPWNLNTKLRDIDLIDLSTGKCETIGHARRIAKYTLSPDGSQIAYTSPTRFERAGSQQILYNLVVVNTSSKQDRVIASDIRLNYSGDSFGWSADGMKLSFRTDGQEERTYDCFVVDLQDGSVRNVSMLSPVEHFQYYKSIKPLWSPDGKDLYFIRGGALWRDSIVGRKAVEIAHVPNRQIVRLIPQWNDILWTQAGSMSTVVLTHDDSGKQDGLYRIDLANGLSTKLVEQRQCYSCMNLQQQFVVTPDAQHVAYFAEDVQHDTDLWMISPNHGGPQQLTHLNPEFDNYEMGNTRLVSWLSDDGDRLQGALLLPSNYQQGKRYPLIVWVYGGLSLSDNVNRFGLAYLSPFNMQVFATRGYAILLPDAPQHLGTPMFDLAKTVLPGVNKVIDLGIADPDRLGVMGHSYGGYSTLALIVQTNRFKAAIDIDGWGDLWGAYGEMRKDGSAYATSFEESGEGLGLMGGTPWQVRARYIENSPLFYFDRIETPVLVVHGTQDSALNSFLGDQVFVALRRLGKRVEYAKYEGEGHDPSEWSEANQADLCNRMIQWFDTHLK